MEFSRKDFQELGKGEELPGPRMAKTRVFQLTRRALILTGEGDGIRRRVLTFPGWQGFTTKLFNLGSNWWGSSNFPQIKLHIIERV